MSAIIDRNVYEPGGLAYEATGGRCRPLPAEVAYVLVDHRGRQHVTWSEVMEERRRRQAARLQEKQRPSEPGIAPCYVWVFDNGPIIPYGGWWCYIVTLRDSQAVNFRGFNARTALSLMRSIPLVPQLATGAETERLFDEWMPRFASQYRVAGPRKRQGKCIGWLADGQFSLARPCAVESNS